MSAFALTLILSAAVLHATWNYLLKRSGAARLSCGSSRSLSAVIYAPLAAGVLWWTRPVLSLGGSALIVASAVIHTAYYLLLDRGYRGGDLSLVYPLARGSAPLITVVAAILLLGEQPTPLAIAGALLIAGGAVVLTSDFEQLRKARSLPAVGFALLTGCMIASYTVVDKLAVAAYLVPPLFLDWATNLGRVFIMAPLALRQRQALRECWRRSRRDIVGVAVLCPLAYILVLSAMVFTPVSYVAPAREISILIGAILGVSLLAEKDGARRAVRRRGDVRRHRMPCLGIALSPHLRFRRTRGKGELSAVPSLTPLLFSAPTFHVSLSSPFESFTPQITNSRSATSACAPRLPSAFRYWLSGKFLLQDALRVVAQIVHPERIVRS